MLKKGNRRETGRMERDKEGKKKKNSGGVEVAARPGARPGTGVQQSITVVRSRHKSYVLVERCIEE